jgi:ubiquinone/menaquinone biosynthesis C-methylase UbiE
MIFVKFKSDNNTLLSMNKNSIKKAIKFVIPSGLVEIWHKRFHGKNNSQIERIKKRIKYNKEGNQDIDIYWDDEFVEILDSWGTDNAWLEIQLLLANCKGKVLDIACGSAPVLEICKDFRNIELYGCDISDKLIARAHELRGIPKEKLLITDATKMDYDDDEFNYSYSIGSLEHFTEEGIDQVIAESYRVTKYGSFHMLPTNEKGENEGWISPLQSYHNNSINWWLGHFKKKYDTVIVVKSKWHDQGRSFGHWFLCYKNLPA